MWILSFKSLTNVHSFSFKMSSPIHFLTIHITYISILYIMIEIEVLHNNFHYPLLCIYLTVSFARVTSWPGVNWHLFIVNFISSCKIVEIKIGTYL